MITGRISPILLWVPRARPRPGADMHALGLDHLESHHWKYSFPLLSAGNIEEFARKDVGQSVGGNRLVSHDIDLNRKALFVGVLWWVKCIKTEGPACPAERDEQWKKPGNLAFFSLSCN